MSASSSSSSGGIGFGGLLTIVFITLKLCGVIAWSWWWVLSPLWLGAAIVLAFLLIVMSLTALALALETPAQRLSRKLKELSRRV